MGETVSAALVAISERVKAANIQELVVQKEADKEIQHRAELVVKALNELEKLRKEFHKHKPNQEFFEADGNKGPAYFTKEALEARKKAQEEIDKVETAIEKALKENDYTKLKEKFSK